jgi:hypothetical protein
MPLPLEELEDELDIPLLPELLDELDDEPPPPSPLEELELLLLAAPDELLEPFVVLVPVSSVHPPKTRSAPEVTKTPTRQS